MWTEKTRLFQNDYTSLHRKDWVLCHSNFKKPTFCFRQISVRVFHRYTVSPATTGPKLTPPCPGLSIWNFKKILFLNVNQQKSNGGTQLWGECSIGTVYSIQTLGLSAIHLQRQAIANFFWFDDSVIAFGDLKYIVNFLHHHSVGV